MIKREGQRKALRLRVTHHKNDAVEAMIVVRGRDFERALLQPLRGCSQAEAADAVARFVQDLNRRIQRALLREAARGPTRADDP